MHCEDRNIGTHLVISKFRCFIQNHFHFCIKSCTSELTEFLRGTVRECLHQKDSGFFFRLTPLLDFSSSSEGCINEKRTCSRINRNLDHRKSRSSVSPTPCWLNHCRDLLCQKYPQHKTSGFNICRTLRHPYNLNTKHQMEYHSNIFSLGDARRNVTCLTILCQL